MNNDKNALLSKSFAVRVVEAYKYVYNEKREFVMSKQFLRSGTSIGANISESTRAQGTKDFYAKLHIALKEAAETEYQIKLLMTANYFEVTKADILLKDLDEIIRMLNSSIQTVKKKLEYREK